MKGFGADFTTFSPRASFMAHHIGDFAISSIWASNSNELCYRVSKIFPNNFIGAAMLPQSPGVDPTTCIHEARKMRERIRLRRHQAESGSVRRLVDEFALADHLREDDRIRHPVQVSTSCNPRLRRSSPVQRHDKKYRHFAATQYAPSVRSSPRRVWIHLT